jgi:hypothetical protein
MGPGLLTLGSNLYSSSQGKREAEERLRRENPELYNRLSAAAQNQLNLAGSADPQAMATQRFQQQQELLRPLRDKQETDLVRMLHGKGMLGLATYQGAGVDPMSKTAQTWAQAPGVSANPHLAAYYSARAGQESKDAYDALSEGDKRIDQLLQRAGALSGNAQSAQPVARVQDQALKAKYGRTPALLKGGAEFLQKNPTVLKDVWTGAKGMFDSFGDSTGLWSSVDPAWADEWSGDFYA